jgi:CRP-like cAMP-binding protein
MSPNLLLAALPQAIRERLQRHGRIVALKEGDILHRPAEEIKDVYFPLDCLISVTVTMSEARTAEAGIVGSREMVGVNAFMGGSETTQTKYVCQAAGSALKVDASLLMEEFDKNKTVRDVMLRYTQAYIAQLSQNVACNRLHTIRQRMARWILECRDRLKADDLTPTHEFISQMLGVRRPGITETAAELQALGLIVYARKRLRVIDPAGLEKESCECFRLVLGEYDRLLGARISS